MNESEFAKMVRDRLRKAFPDYEVNSGTNLQHSMIFTGEGKPWPADARAMGSKKLYAYQVDIVLSNGTVPVCGEFQLTQRSESGTSHRSGLASRSVRNDGAIETAPKLAMRAEAVAKKFSVSAAGNHQAEKPATSADNFPPMNCERYREFESRSLSFYLRFGDGGKSAQDVALFRSKGTRESKLRPDAPDLDGVLSARRKVGSLQDPEAFRPAFARSSPASKWQ